MSLEVPNNQGQGQQQTQGQQMQGGQPTTRAMQQGIGNRVNTLGQAIQRPRLAGPKRKSEGGIIKNAVKKKAKKWLIGAAFGGVIGGTGFGLFTLL